MSTKKKQKPGINRLEKKKQAFWSQRNIIIAVILVAAIVTSYFLFFKKSSNEPKWVKEGEVTFLSKDDRRQLAKIDVEAAKDPAKRQQGLMYRSHMDEDKGMIFIFEREDMQAFWMKNTILPLDIIFIDSKGVINTIHKNTVPYSEKSLPSKSRSQFVVEVNGGYCDKYGIKEGDLIEYKLDHK
jgi:uncharacterized membrane protein (UPF0127 family)